MKKVLVFSVVVLLAGFSALSSQDKLSEILKGELDRNMSALKEQEVPPYYMSYRVNDVTTYTVSASFGQIVSSNESRERKVCVHVRVGNHKLDNKHPLKDESYGWYDWDEGETVAVEDSDLAVKQALWLETNKQYLKAADMYEKVLANVAIKVEDEDTSEDFSVEKPFVFKDKPLNRKELAFDLAAWEGKLKKYSAVFLENEDLLDGNARIVFTLETKYFVSSEGSDITENRTACRLSVSAQTRADDGMDLPLNFDYFAFSPSKMPSDDAVLKEASEMSGKLSKLRTAPVADSFTGPALLGAASAGVFFHEIFGHRIEGHSMKDETDAQTFKKKVGDKILCADLSVIFDPSVKEYEGFYLNGAYKYDDQGQPGKRVTIVEDGVLKDFLMSRTPIDGFPNSNGHGRAQAGVQAVSRQSNMFVTSKKPYTNEELRKMLVEEAKKQGKEYGYLFVETVGGFTMTGRYTPNAFNVTPVEVYRIYTDGRPDELIRGVDLVGTPLSVFSSIEAAGSDFGLFTGTCGAESGWVPVSTVCPTVFVKQIETQRKPKEQNRLPILPRP